MNPNPTIEEARKRFLTLPSEVQDAVISEESAYAIKRVAEKYRLSTSEAGVLADGTGLVLMGFIPPEDLSRHLQNQLAIDEVKAKNLSREIDQEIYSRVKTPLEKFLSGLSRGEKTLAYSPSPSTNLGSSPSKAPGKPTNPFEKKLVRVQAPATTFAEKKPEAISPPKPSIPISARPAAPNIPQFSRHTEPPIPPRPQADLKPLGKSDEHKIAHKTAAPPPNLPKFHPQQPTNHKQTNSAPSQAPSVEPPRPSATSFSATPKPPPPPPRSSSFTQPPVAPQNPPPPREGGTPSWAYQKPEGETGVERQKPKEESSRASEPEKKRPAGPDPYREPIE